jgi:hypothetical protein
MYAEVAMGTPTSIWFSRVLILYIMLPFIKEYAS